MYSKNQLTIEKLDICRQSAEIIVVYVMNLDICIIAIYRSHSFTIEYFNNELQFVLNSIKYKNILIIGDLNINIFDSQNKHS